MNYGRIIQTERIKSFEVADNVFAAITPYRGICWANAAFINHGEGLVYDTFFDVFHAQEMKKVYRQVSGKKNPGYVVYSHYNVDHIYGNRAFEDSCVIMHKECARERKTESYDYWNEIVSLNRTPRDASVGHKFLANELRGFDLTGVDWDFKPDIEIESDINIRLGDTVAQVLPVGPAHSDSDCLLWMPKEKVLFAGDVVFCGAGSYTEQGTRNWINVLNCIIDELKPEVVVPGHGAICGIDFVKEQRDYFENLLVQFEKYYDEDITSMELCKKMDISDFLHWIQPERLFISVDALVRGRRGISERASWDAIPDKLTELRGYLTAKYGDRILPWDPMCSWAEQ